MILPGFCKFSVLDNKSITRPSSKILSLLGDEPRNTLQFGSDYYDYARKLAD
jgi:hypothetical protein